jgi:2-hydroxychromene-2-carboxylate isomerase
MPKDVIAGVADKGVEAVRAAVSRIASRILTSRTLRELARARRRSPGVPVIDYFHQADDPYSHLVVQLLPALARRYEVEVRPHLVPPPDDAAAPERARLRAYALRDAARLAAEYGLEFPEGARLPEPHAVRSAAAALAAALAEADFAERAVDVGAALWTGRTAPAEGDGATALALGAAERERLGHYLGGMLHFEGEWFWGVDRLNHLEERLSARGRDREPGQPPIAPYRDAGLAKAVAGAGPTVIECWFSFRSPYSWIAFPRVRALARRHGAELRLRYILPMVMRGLPVPRVKARYIMFDTKREAERVGLPFGTIVDPVGAGAERALAVAHAAVPLGLAEEFSERALRGAWAEGVDLASDKGLYGVAQAAGLTKAQVDAALADEGWRAAAEANREALFEAGLWGAPSYRVNGGPAHWGQDRLWALEQDLVAAVA